MTPTSRGPRWSSLFHGAVRESLAAANSVARIGIQDTRAWEGANVYVADDNQGNVGVVEFQPDGAIAAMSARAPERILDRTHAIGFAPPGLRDALARISERPLLQEGAGVSEIFWTTGEFLQGPENWEDMGQHGVELFDRELLSDSEWEEVGVPFYDLSAGVARVAIAASARAVVRVPMLRLTEDEFRLLIPKNSKHESVAVGLLLSEGLFEIESVARG